MSNNKALFIVVVIVVFFQSLISFQGFDVCDEGFSLTFYQQIFNAPETVEYNFIYWLSGFIGGLWYKLFEEGGILWFRILAIIVNTTTFIISYKILVPYINRWYALVGLSMVLIANDFGYLVFYHNHLTALLAVSSIFFLIEGLTKNKLLLLGISGFICAVNVSARLPNASLFVLIICIPFYYYLKNVSLYKIIKPVFFYVAGIIFGLAFIFIVLYSFGQLEVMKRSLFGIIDNAETKTSNHNFLYLIQQYIISYKKVIMALGKLFLLSAFVLFFANKFRNSRFYNILIFTISVIIFCLFLKFGNIYILYSLLLIGTIGLLFSKQEKNIKLIALCALIMAIFLPLGSDWGITNAGYMAMWLGVPLFFYFIFQINKLTFTSELSNQRTLFSISRVSIKLLIVVLIASYFIKKFYNISQESYFDLGSRFEKTYTINSALAKNIYTTKERAEIINSLILNLENYVKPDDYLLAYDNIPMIHFLTKTKPYMYNPWVWVYDSYSFEKKIKRAEKEISVLPIVVQQKFNTTVEFSNPTTDYMDETKEDTYSYNKGRMIAMNAFLERNAYQIVWSNAYFNIYKSSKNLQIKLQN